MGNYEAKIKILMLAEDYKNNLAYKVRKREEEMSKDNTEHYLLYKALGFTPEDGQLIDLYQNIGRFLYTNAGSFIEEAALICFRDKFGYMNAKKVDVYSTTQPKRKYEIDCLVNERLAIEFKWRDATTDGDHVRKETDRIECIYNAGYRPIRVMFFYPNREQAKQIQDKIKGIYDKFNGEYYAGKDAFNYVKYMTDIDLYNIISSIQHY